MRLFRVEEGGAFEEFVKTSFQDRYSEAILEDWLVGNTDGIVEDGRLLLIGRQVTTNLGTTIDLLAVDRQGDVVVLELKRDRTPRETLAQALVSVKRWIGSNLRAFCAPTSMTSL